MTVLAAQLVVRPRDVRAVDLDNDVDRPEPLDGYAVGAHVLDGVRQVVTGWQAGPRTRAWSVTGPYGAGKSAFAHFVVSLHGSPASPARERAHELLDAVDAQLAETVNRELMRVRAGAGFIAAVVRAQREPVADATVRALLHGAERYWSGRRKPAAVKELRGALEAGVAPQGAGEVVLHWIEQLSSTAPVLLIIDELGKALEHAHARPEDNDLYLLQQIAEYFSSHRECAGGLVTLQHLAFEDYLAGVSEARRREWRKVQGRFADLPFVADADHGHRLVAGAISWRNEYGAARARASEVIGAAERAVIEIAGDAKLPSAATGDPAATYPLHPTAAIALPELLARYGQHDRSLVAFLAGQSPAALPAFLRSAVVTTKQQPFLRLHNLYDAFVEDPEAGQAPGPDGGRLREARARINDAIGLEGLALDCVKTVAVLNLVASRRGLRADPAVIEEALVGPGSQRAARRDVRAILDRLVADGILVWRAFAGEYRVWQGSDVDIDSYIAVERERLAASGDGADVLTLLAQARPLRAQVARRHSLAHDILRYFECRYALAIGDEVVCSSPDADGLVLVVLGENEMCEVPATTTDGRPLVVVHTAHGGEVLNAALDAAATAMVLKDEPEVNNDPVARREVRHRTAMAQAAVAERLESALDHRREGVAWFNAGRRRAAGTPVEFTRLLSDLCDQRYPQTPVLRTEMLNRRELTSQGAKTRGELLRRMFEHADQPRLSIEGYGPERSMYEAVLAATGLHALGDEHWEFMPPTDPGLAAAFAVIERFFDGAADSPRHIDRLYEQLMAPPLGMKDGPIPVLLAAALLYRNDDVFLYQDGTFMPTVGPADLERLLKSPGRFSIKRAAFLRAQSDVFHRLQELLSTVAPATKNERNRTTLTVVRPLLTHWRSLPGYTKQTERIGETARAVRNALAAAREPDALLLDHLPRACGLLPFSNDGSPNANAVAAFVATMKAALNELAQAYDALLTGIEGLLRAAFEVPRGQVSVREDLRARSAHLAEHVIDPRARGFLLTASDSKPNDREWFEAIAMNVAVKPVTSWTDGDADLFESQLAERARWFFRLEALHQDLRNASATGFTSRRVTVTSPEGREAGKLVALNDGRREQVGSQLDELLAKLAKIEDHPEQALLAILADRLLTDETQEARAPARLRAVEAS